MAESIAEFINNYPQAFDNLVPEEIDTLKGISNFLKKADILAGDSNLGFAYFYWHDSRLVLKIHLQKIIIKTPADRFGQYKEMIWDQWDEDFSKFGAWIKENFPKIYRDQEPKIIKRSIKRRI